MKKRLEDPNLYEQENVQKSKRRLNTEQYILLILEATSKPVNRPIKMDKFFI